MSNDLSQRRRGVGSGLAFVVTGPSGAGKTSVIDRVMEDVPNLAFSVSYTSRGPRPGEVEGRDYFFVSKRAFLDRVEDGDFLEHVTYMDDHYGTSRSQIDAWVAAGSDVLLNIEVQGARKLREKALDGLHVVYVFLTPPSIETLESRLRGRDTESDEVIRRRLDVALHEIDQMDAFDYLVINDDLETAVNELASIIMAERARLL